MALMLSVALRRRWVLSTRTTILIVLVLIVILRSTVRSILTRGAAAVGLLLLRRIAWTAIPGLLSISRPAAAVASLLGRRPVLIVSTAATVPSLVVARGSWAAVACLRESALLVLGLAVLPG